MNDYDLLVNGKIFVCALRMRCPDKDDRVNADVDVFSRAAGKRATAGSKFAAKFELYDSPMGFRFSDFERMMSLLCSATLIAWVGPSFRCFVFEVSLNFAQQVLAKLDPVEHTEALSFADDYLRGIK